MFNYIKNICFCIYYKLYNILIRQNNDSINFQLNNINYNYDYNYDNSSLKIISYNINGLFCYYNHNNYTNIAKFIKNELIKNNVDIICLQEVWLKNIFDLIIEEIKYLNIYIASPSRKIKYYIGEHSGLLVISKLPIINNTFIKYNNLNYFCKLTNKGFQHISIKYNNKFVHIINTHLQSSSSSFNYRDNNLLQINNIIHYCNNNNITKYLITGDLNLNQNYIHKILNKYPNINIPYKYVNNKNDNNDTEENYITCPYNNEILDYFLFVNNIFDNKYTKYIVKKNIQFSDHYPIYLEIN